MNRLKTPGRFRAMVATASLLGLAASGLSSAASAQQSPSPSASVQAKAREGAVQYWQGFAAMPAMDETQQKIVANWNVVPLDSTAEKIIANSTPSLNQLHRGSACEKCDWGLNKEDGLLMLLPHVAKARDLTRLACLRARYRLENGQPAAAVDDITDTLILARRAAEGDVAIAIIVQHAMEQMAIDTLAPHLKLLNQPTLATLADRLAKLPPGGSVQASIQVERDLGPESLVRALNDSQKNGLTAEQILGQCFKDVASLKVAGITPQAIAERVAKVRPIYDQYAEALRLPQEQARTRLVELSKVGVEDPLAAAILPNYVVFYDRHSAAQTRFAMLQAAIAVLRNGPPELKNFPDPSTGQPFEHHEQGDGFELRSKLLMNGAPVVLAVE